MMRTVACWLPPLPYSGPHTQAGLLVPALRTLGIELQADLYDANVLGALVDLRRTTADVVHLVGVRALRRFFLCGRWQRPPLVVSLNGHERLTRFDKWCLARVARIVVTFPAAVAHFTAQGLPASKLVIIPPGVQPPPAFPVQEFRRSRGIADDGIVLFASGSLHRPNELTDAIWAYEIMRYTSDRYHLFAVGDGPERPRAEAFAAGLAPEGTRVQFLGARPDVPALVQVADVVLVTPSSGGLAFALEALAAGRVVVAHRTPQLASVLHHEHNGLLIDKGNHPQAAKALTRIIQEPDLRERLSAAGRVTAAAYTIERAATAWHAVYTLS